VRRLSVALLSPGDILPIDLSSITVSFRVSGGLGERNTPDREVERRGGEQARRNEREA
jgi:hypothetical protein